MSAPVPALIIAQARAAVARPKLHSETDQIRAVEGTRATGKAVGSV
jgi:hypothetical protein